MKHIRNALVVLCGFLSISAAIAGPKGGPPVFQMRLVGGVAPEIAPSSNLETFTAIRTNNLNGLTHKETLYVEKTVLLDNNGLKSTQVVTNTSTMQPEIEFELTATGQTRFAEITRENIGKRLAIIIDGQLFSAPVIRSEISGGRGMISGDFTPSDAKKLSDKINAALKK